MFSAMAFGRSFRGITASGHADESGRGKRDARPVT